MVYQLYKSSTKQRKISYPLVNVCVLIIQRAEKGLEKGLRKAYAESFMVSSFKFFIKKWIAKNFNRIKDYFNESINGFHQDMMDIYQELYIHFFELIQKFNVNGEVYFVIFLKKFIYFWMNNRFKMNKKEKVSQISLETTVSKTIHHHEDANLSILDSSDYLNLKSATGTGEDEVHLEEFIINRMLVEQFERNYINNVKYFRNEDSQLIYHKIYTYFFMERKVSKAEIGDLMGISQQKVRYYLEKIIRMFQNFSKNY